MSNFSTKNKIAANVTANKANGATGVGARALRSIFSVCGFQKRCRLVLMSLFLVLLSGLGSKSFGAWTTPYTFFQPTSTYSAIAGTALFSGVDDNVYNSPTLPFTFVFNGTGYTSFYVSSNGFIQFGSSPGTTQYTPLTASTGNGVIAAWAGDMVTSCSYLTIGATPNRTFVMQFSGNRYGQTETLNWQIKLHETSNAIEIVYGTCTLSGTVAGSGTTPEVGIRDGSASDYYDRTGTVWATTSAGGSGATINTSGTAAPASGLTFVYLPQHTLFTMPQSLTFGSSCPNASPADLSVTLMGAALTANITATPATNFPIMNPSSGTYSTTAITITAGATYGPTTINMRATAAAAAGSYTGSGVFSSSGTTSATVQETGTSYGYPTPTFTAQPGATSCSGAAYPLTYTTQAGMTNYIWTFPGTAGVDYTIVSGGTTASNTVTLYYITAGAKVVGINYTNANGCTAVSATNSSTTTITLSPVISGTFAICQTTSTTLTGTPSGGAWLSVTPAVATITTPGGLLNGVGAGTSVISYTQGGCTAVQTETINASPAAISGASAVCNSASITLSNSVAIGSWTTTPGTGSVSVTTGTSTTTVTGLTVGTATVSYSTGCGTPASKVITINNAPSAISAATTTVCQTQTIAMTDGVAGGVWASSAPSIATVSGTGVVTGVNIGAATIVYSITATGCLVSLPVTVVSGAAIPTVSAAVLPTSGCSPASAALTATPGGIPVTYSVASTPYSLATITTSSGSVSGDDNYSGPVALPFTFNYFGTAYNSIYVGTNGYVTFSTGVTGYTNYAIPSSGAAGEIGPGIAFGLCDLNTGSGGTINFGYTGTAPNRQFIIYFNGVADYGGSGTISGQIILYETTGIIDEMLTLRNPVGHTWTLGVQGAGAAQGTAPATRNSVNTAVTTPEGWRYTPTSPTFVWSPATFLSSTSVQNPNIVSATATTTYSVTAYYNSCYSNAGTATFTVNNAPAAISGGTAAFCNGASITVSDATTGGTWTTTPGTGAVTVTTGSTTSTITGTAAGTATVIYTTPCGTASIVVTVNVTPTISGQSTICVSTSSVTLSGTPSGGTWVSLSPAIVGVGAGTGLLTSGASTGSSTIQYTVNGCTNTSVWTETVTNVGPPAISGASAVCNSSSITLSNTTSGGAWTTTPGTGSVNVTTGSPTSTITGLTVGTATVSYSTGCGTPAFKIITVNNAPSAINGTTTAYRCGRRRCMGQQRVRYCQRFRYRSCNRRRNRRCNYSILYICNRLSHKCGSYCNFGCCNTFCNCGGITNIRLCTGKRDTYWHGYRR